jgi:DNA/RNA-binding domain of Phe-tRNA-synthetase-like protein
MTLFLDEAGGKPADFCLGILALEGLQSGQSGNQPDLVKHELEDTLRTQYGASTRAELKARQPMAAYVAYYKKYGYTYHVLLQLESVLKGKEIPDAPPPVRAMFMAELKNQLLTAGHDLDKIAAPLTLGISDGTESFTSIGGSPVASVAGDILIADGEGVISSILRGPDRRTAITAETKRAVYTVYAPPGVGEAPVRGHLDDIEAYVRLFSPGAVTLEKRTYCW